MKTAYFDCIAGASGDMILGALLDAGLSEEALRGQLALLHLDDFELAIRQVDKQGFSALKVDVKVKDDVPARHLPARSPSGPRLRRTGRGPSRDAGSTSTRSTPGERGRAAAQRPGRRRPGP